MAREAAQLAAGSITVFIETAEIGPVPMSSSGRNAELELDRLSNILKNFNDQFGTLFTDADRVMKRIREDIAPKVAADQAYQNAKKNTPNAADIELNAALNRVITPLYKDDTEFFKQFVQNESFRSYANAAATAARSRSIPAARLFISGIRLCDIRSIVSFRQRSLAPDQILP